jgi:hypothetical protein
MVKKLFLATAVTGLLVGTALPVQAATTTVQPGMSCKEAAKLQHPGDRSAQRAYKQACKEAFKGSQTTAAAKSEEPTYAGDM